MSSTEKSVSTIGADVADRRVAAGLARAHEVVADLGRLVDSTASERDAIARDRDGNHQLYLGALAERDALQAQLEEERRKGREAETKGRIVALVWAAGPWPSCSYGRLRQECLNEAARLERSLQEKKEDPK